MPQICLFPDVYCYSTYTAPLDSYTCYVRISMVAGCKPDDCKGNMITEKLFVKYTKSINILTTICYRSTSYCIFILYLMSI